MWVIIATVLGGIFIDIQIAEAHKVEAQGIQEVITVIEPKEVRLEIVYNWTPETIERHVLEAFPDAPIMLKVMKCESGYKTDAYNPTNGSGDRGLFQVSTKYHGERVKRLGLDMTDPHDNIKFARLLYDEGGLQPWSASKHCWSK